MIATSINDKELLSVFLDPIRKSGKYKPAFGLGRKTGISLNEFEEIYSEDLFYNWIGLNTSSVYSAHKAAGGLTSVYRQIGVGAESLFRLIVMACLLYTSPSPRDKRQSRMPSSA